MGIVTTTPNVFVNITKCKTNLNLTIVYKATIKGPSVTPSNIEDRVFFATKTNIFQPSTFAYILGLSYSCAKMKHLVEVNVVEIYVLRENTKELCETLRKIL